MRSAFLMRAELGVEHLAGGPTPPSQQEIVDALEDLARLKGWRIHLTFPHPYLEPYTVIEP